METKSNINVQIERVDTRTEVGRFAEFAYALGYDMQLIHDVVRDLPRETVVLRRDNLAPITEDLSRLVYLAALASGKSIDDVIEKAIRARFKRWHVQTDTPLSDLPGLGEMHYGGHEDED